MTQYTKPKFTVPLTSREYREAWDRVFGTPATQPNEALNTNDTVTQAAPPTTVQLRCHCGESTGTQVGAEYVCDNCGWRCDVPTFRGTNEALYTNELATKATPEPAVTPDAPVDQLLGTVISKSAELFDELTTQLGQARAERDQWHRDFDRTHDELSVLRKQFYKVTQDHFAARAEAAGAIEACARVVETYDPDPGYKGAVQIQFAQAVARIIRALDPGPIAREWQERLERAEAAAVDQRIVGHGEGQEHTIADVNAGRVDDLIAPRLADLRAKLEAATKRAERAEDRKNLVGISWDAVERNDADLRAKLADAERERDEWRIAAEHPESKHAVRPWVRVLQAAERANAELRAAIEQERTDLQGWANYTQDSYHRSEQAAEAREARLREALLSVREMYYGAPCWCDPHTKPDEHEECCLNARAALADTATEPTTSPRDPQENP